MRFTLIHAFGIVAVVAALVVFGPYLMDVIGLIMYCVAWR